MAASVYFVLATVLFAQCLGRNSPKKSFDDLLNEGKEQLENALEGIKKDIGLPKDPNGEQIVKLLRDKNDEMANNLKDFAKKIEKQFETDPQAKKIADDIKAKINEAADKLKKERPEIAQNAEKFGEALKGAWTTMITDVEKNMKEFNKKGGKRDEIDEFFKNLIDKGNALSKDLKEKVGELVSFDKKP